MPLLLALLSVPSGHAEDAPPDVPIEVGPVVSKTTLDVVPTNGLVLTQCAAPHIETAVAVPSGTVVLEVRVRRGKVSLVTVAAQDEAVAGFVPCFERELTAFAWPFARGDVRVPVYVGDAKPAPPPVR